MLLCGSKCEYMHVNTYLKKKKKKERIIIAAIKEITGKSRHPSDLIIHAIEIAIKNSIYLYLPTRKSSGNDHASNSWTLGDKMPRNAHVLRPLPSLPAIGLSNAYTKLLLSFNLITPRDLRGTHSLSLAFGVLRSQIFDPRVLC